MTTPLYRPISKNMPGAKAPLASDVTQLVDLMNGNLDAGVINLATQISAPSITGITATASAGTALGIGAYIYKFTYVTGLIQSDGSVTVGGETPGSSSLNVTTTSGNQNVTISGLPAVGSWPSTAIGIRIYRTAVGGADGSQKLVGAVFTNYARNSNQTTFTDSTADTSLGTAVPTTNTTGTSFAGGNFSSSATANSVAVRDANGNVAGNYPVSNNQNPNLLFNPSFRLGFNGWTLNGTGTGASWATYFGSYGEGGFATVTSSTATSATTFYESVQIPVSSGTQLSISADLCTGGQTAGQTACIELHAFGSGGTDLGAITSLTQANGSGWNRLKALGTTPANTSYVTVRLIYWTGSISTYTQFRKIKVESNSFSTTFSDDNTLNTVQYNSSLINALFPTLPIGDIILLDNQTQLIGSSAGAQYSAAPPGSSSTSASPASVGIQRQVPVSGMYKFQAIATTNAGNTGYVQLYNVTDGTVVTTLSTTSSTYSQISGSVSLLAGKVYQVRVYQNSSGTVYYSKAWISAI